MKRRETAPRVRRAMVRIAVAAAVIPKVVMVEEAASVVLVVEEVVVSVAEELVELVGVAR